MKTRSFVITVCALLPSLGLRADELASIRRLIESHDIQAASALLSIKLALADQISASTRLRYLLLKGVAEAELGHFSLAKQYLQEARGLYAQQLAQRENLLAAIEIAEFDVLEMEKR